MDRLQRRHEWLRRVAWLCAALVLAITSLSAFIRLSNAGLGCADWPRCYGSQLRDVQQGRPAVAADDMAVATARLAHRGAAVFALLGVVTMVVLCLGSRPWLKYEGAIALALLTLALLLAVLGRWTAGARVPAVAIGNLVGGALMLAASWRLVAARGSAGPRRERGRAAWAGVGAVLLLGQIALGGLVSSSFAGLSCAGPGDCLDAARAAGWPWQMLDPWREPVFDAASSPPLNAAGALAQWVHRGGALGVLLVLAPLGLVAMRGPRRREGIALLVLLALQIALGGVMVMTGLPLPIALAHNIVAVCLLATVIRLA